MCSLCLGFRVVRSLGFCGFQVVLKAFSDKGSSGPLKGFYGFCGRDPPVLRVLAEGARRVVFGLGFRVLGF